MKILVWNFVFRLWHWGFAISLCASIYIGTFYHPESDVFKYHMLFGVLAAVLLAVRIVLGFAGARAVRWRNFFYSPAQTFRYFVNVICLRKSAHDKINPGTALAATGMYLSLTALVYTGFETQYVEEWHGRFSNILIGLIALHLLGLVIHSVLNREWIALAMIHGRKSAQPGDLPQPENWTGGWAMLGLICAVSWMLYYFFDIDSSVLKLPGIPPINFPFIQKG